MDAFKSGTRLKKKKSMNNLNLLSENRAFRMQVCSLHVQKSLINRSPVLKQGKYVILI